jgi:hypothetical protein
MPTLTYQYVYFASGPHSRQPRASSGPGGFTLIQSLPGGTLSNGDTFVASPQPASQTVGANVYPFAFVNVSGGTPAGQTSLKAAVPAPSVTVGTQNIVVLVVYAPTGGSGGPNTGATIDSFDMATGSLFNDTFVKVSPDPTGTLTTSGNVEGYVDTTSIAETITALSPTLPTGVDFVQWLTLPQSVSTSPALAVGKGVSVSALAFYQTPPPLPPPNACQETVTGLQQIIDDGDRPLLTVAQFNAIKAQLEKCVQEGQVTQARVNQLITDYESGLNRTTPPPSGPPKV